MKMSLVDRLKRILGGGGDDEPGSPHPISCIEALERVHEFLDGEMEEADAADVAHHFRICQKCYPHLRLEERFREALLRAQAAERCPEEVRAQVMEVLGAEAAEGGGGL
jgi:anti-sigma factor (TIGR02949 family)